MILGKRVLLLTILIILNITCLIAQDFALKDNTYLYTKSNLKEKNIFLPKNTCFEILRFSSPGKDSEGNIKTAVKISLIETNDEGWINAKLIKNKYIPSKVNYLDKILIPEYYISSMKNESLDEIIANDYTDPEWNLTRNQIYNLMKSQFTPWLLEINEGNFSFVGPESGFLFQIIKISEEQNAVIYELVSKSNKNLKLEISVTEKNDLLELLILESTIPKHQLFFRVDLLEQKYLYATRKEINVIEDFIREKTDVVE